MKINLNTREIDFKLVYYGPGLSGKTTNLQVIHKKTSENNRGKLTSIATEQDRTLFFDFMPMELGTINGLKVKLRIFTVPGQVRYNETRKLVLSQADGVVFVADSQNGKMEENIESLENLRANLLETDLRLEEMPLVIQFNKRDIPNAMSLESMEEALNSQLKVPTFPAVAASGSGVFETLRSVTHLTVTKIEQSMRSSSGPVVRHVAAPPKKNEMSTRSELPKESPGGQKTLPQMKPLSSNKGRESPSTPTSSGTPTLPNPASHPFRFPDAGKVSPAPKPLPRGGPSFVQPKAMSKDAGNVMKKLKNLFGKEKEK